MGIKYFSIENLFPIIEQGKSKGLNHLKKLDSGVEYLGATNLNNAVLCKVEPDNRYIQKGNCIAFIRNGEGSMGFSVYKKNPFIATSDISVGYNENLNLYVGTYLTTVADTIRGKYNFGYKRTSQRLKKELLGLPINEQGTPDWFYMESQMRDIETKQLLQYLKYAVKKIFS